MRALYRLYINLVKLSLASFALRFSYCPTAHFLRFSVPYYAHPNFVAGGRGSSTFTVASLAVSENRSLLLPSVSAASLLVSSPLPSPFPSVPSTPPSHSVHTLTRPSAPPRLNCLHSIGRRVSVTINLVGEPAGPYWLVARRRGRGGHPRRASLWDGRHVRLRRSCGRGASVGRSQQ